jgi:hypothetical protein
MGVWLSGGHIVPRAGQIGAVLRTILRSVPNRKKDANLRRVEAMFRVHGGNGFGRIALLAFIIAGVSDLRAETWKVPGTYTLPKIGLSAFLDEQLGLANIDDHNIDLGGIGSDLWHSKANDGPGIYWMITNRGPNGEDPRTFPVPEFTPFILKLRSVSPALTS